MNNFPYGTHLVMELDKNGNISCNIGYMYNLRIFFSFIYTTFTGSSLRRKMCKSKWCGHHVNIHVCLFRLPYIMYHFVAMPLMCTIMKGRVIWI